jgi:hypothetical protein
MNLQTAITLLAGGPGSGCHGPNCGRPIKEGDTVTMKPGTSSYHPKSGGKFEFPHGTELKVSNVMPKIGHSDQMVAVEPLHPVKGLGGMVPYAKMSDLELQESHDSRTPPVFSTPSKVSRSGNFIPVTDKSGHIVPPDPNAISIKSVPKSQVIMQTKTSDGARLTWVKPKDETENIKNLSSEPHRLKGDFALISKVTKTVPAPGEYQGEKRVSRIYDTSSMPAHLHQGPGASVQVDAYLSNGKIKGVNVTERNYTTSAQRVSQGTFEYRNTSKDKTQIAKSVGMLKQRYGIKTSLKNLVRSN